MMKKRKLTAFADAFRGILETFRSEWNFKVHVIAACTALAMGLWASLSIQEWFWIFLCIALVFALELVNTAIEAAIDLVSPQYHPLAKKAKDAAAGAVLVVAFFAFIIGLLIFGPKLWGLF